MGSPCGESATGGRALMRRDEHDLRGHRRGHESGGVVWTRRTLHSAWMGWGIDRYRIPPIYICPVVCCCWRRTAFDKTTRLDAEYGFAGNAHPPSRNDRQYDVAVHHVLDATCGELLGPEGTNRTATPASLYTCRFVSGSGLYAALAALCGGAFHAAHTQRSRM